MHFDDSSTWTRRQILTSGLATAGALALGARSRAADSPAAGAYGPFKMAIQSYSLRAFPIDDALAKTGELGLSYWESSKSHIPADPARGAEFKAKLAASGVQALGYGVMKFTKDRDASRKLFEFGKALGVSYFSADPDPDSFDSLDSLVEEYGISLGIHNHGPGHRYAKIDDIARAIKGHHEKIGCCIDTGHFLRSREDPVRALEVFGKRTYGVHLKDVKNAEEFTILGQGDLRLTDLLKGLAKLDYSNALALEYEENKDAPMDDIRACLAAVRKTVASM